ncbi:MAG: MSHA biogenesis protein MshP [Pseudomonadota bacterium]
MCPRQTYNNSCYKQQGFLLPLALFILVVMSLFALVLSRNTIQTSNASVLEMISVQAFYAAESGGQRGMQVLFFPNGSSRQGVDTRCNAMNNTYAFTVTGLNNCSAVVTCICLHQDNNACTPGTATNYSASAAPVKLISFYKISSVATCGSGNLRSVRTIEAGSYLKQE